MCLCNLPKSMHFSGTHARMMVWYSCPSPGDQNGNSSRDQSTRRWVYACEQMSKSFRSVPQEVPEVFSASTPNHHRADSDRHRSERPGVEAIKPESGV